MSMLESIRLRTAVIISWVHLSSSTSRILTRSVCWFSLSLANCPMLLTMPVELDRKIEQERRTHEPSGAFDARCAAGHRSGRIAGFVTVAIFGTHSTREAYVPAAFTRGI